MKELLLEPEDPRPSSSGPARVTGVVLDDGTQLPADLVVGCDGRGSTIRRLAGLELNEDNPALEVLWFELESEAAAHLQPWVAGRFATLLGDAGSYALFGTARGGVRVGWLQERGAAGSPSPGRNAGPAALRPSWRPSGAACPPPTWGRPCGWRCARGWRRAGSGPA